MRNYYFEVPTGSSGTFRPPICKDEDCDCCGKGGTDTSPPESDDYGSESSS